MRSRLGRGPPSLFSDSCLFSSSAWGYPAPLGQAVRALCLGPSASPSLPPTLCPPSSQGFEGPVGEVGSVAWPMLPSAPGRPLAPTRGFERGPKTSTVSRVPLRSPWSLGNVTYKPTQLKRHKEGTGRWSSPLGEAVGRKPYTGTTPSLWPQVLLGTCKQPCPSLFYRHAHLSPRKAKSHKVIAARSCRGWSPASFLSPHPVFQFWGTLGSI